MSENINIKQDAFSGLFNMMKIKYHVYDESLTSKNFLQSNDKVNVFINLESIYKYLSCIQELERKILMNRNFNTLIISNILNLAAHYKSFFKRNGLDTKVYLYQTDFYSDEFAQFKYNENYRSYFLEKFNTNPKIVLLTERLKEQILPEVKTYCEFIPDVYFISAKNIEGSLIPYIISNIDKSRKNLIIGSELYDIQYSAIPNFVNHCIHKSISSLFLFSNITDYLKYTCKKQIDENDFIETFNSYNGYCSLLSVLGDRARSIDRIQKCTPKALQKYIKAGLDQNIIQNTTTTPEIFGDIFHNSDTKDEFVNNYYCSSILSMYDELTKSDINTITNQINDRIDMNTLESLNATRFYENSILLEALLN